MRKSHPSCHVCAYLTMQAPPARPILDRLLEPRPERLAGIARSAAWITQRQDLPGHHEAHNMWYP